MGQSLLVWWCSGVVLAEEIPQWGSHCLCDGVEVSRRIPVDGEVIACGDTNDILNDKETLNSSNLELLLPLKLQYLLDEEGISNDKVKDILWQLSLNK